MTISNGCELSKTQKLDSHCLRRDSEESVRQIVRYRNTHRSRQSASRGTIVYRSNPPRPGSSIAALSAGPNAVQINRMSQLDLAPIYDLPFSHLPSSFMRRAIYFRAR